MMVKESIIHTLCFSNSYYNLFLTTTKPFICPIDLHSRISKKQSIEIEGTGRLK